MIKTLNSKRGKASRHRDKQQLDMFLQIEETEPSEKLISNAFQTLEKVLQAAQLKVSCQSAALPPSRDESIPVITYEAAMLQLEYYKCALRESRILFWVGVIGAVSGYIWILIGFIWTLFLSHPLADNLVLLRLAPGAVTATISHLFFIPAKSARDRAAQLFNQLRSDCRFERASDLAESIEDQQLRDQVKARMCIEIQKL